MPLVPSWIWPLFHLPSPMGGGLLRRSNRTKAAADLTVGLPVTIRVLLSERLLSGQILGICRRGRSTIVTVVAPHALLPDTDIVIFGVGHCLRGRVHCCIGWGSGYRISLTPW